MNLLTSEIDKENNLEVLTELKKVLETEKEKVKASELTETQKAKKTNLIEKAEKKIESKLKILQNNAKSSEINNNEVKVKEQTITVTRNELYKEIDSKRDTEDKKIIQKQSSNIKDPDILEFLNYMKLEINTIEYKLKGELNVFQLKYIKSRIIELTNKRENFKSNYIFSEIKHLYKSKDKYNILEDNEKLESLSRICQNKLDLLNIAREEKKKSKKIKKEEIDFEEIKKINEYLDKQIKKQNLEINKLKLIILKTEKKLRKNTMLINIKNMITNSIKVCIGVIPASIFKSKLIGGLVSSFMLNNSIRSIRNLINEDQIEYARLLNNINNQKDLIFHTRLVYEDAITQIEFLKYDLLSRFSFTDLKEIFQKLYEIGEELKRKNKILSELEIELEEQYSKARMKTKKYAA